MVNLFFDVIIIGNVIVDVFVNVDDLFLIDNVIEKGVMMFIDEIWVIEIYGFMFFVVEILGGLVGNMVVGIVLLGGKVGYVGKVCDDQLGEVFVYDLCVIGVMFEMFFLDSGLVMVCCFIFVMFDVQCSMNMYLGVCQEFDIGDIYFEFIVVVKVFYMEGYFYDCLIVKEVFYKVVKIFKEVGNKVSLIFLDLFCVDWYRNEFLDFIKEYVDILFVNEDELKLFYEIEYFNVVCDLLVSYCDLVVVIWFEKGFIIVNGVDCIEVVVFFVEKFVDMIGVGDQYVVGFFYGYVQGFDFIICGKLGSMVVVEVISYFGVRLEVLLSDLVCESGLIQFFLCLVFFVIFDIFFCFLSFLNIVLSEMFCVVRMISV